METNKLLVAGMVMTASLFGASSVLEYSMKSIDGKPAPLAAYKGKVVLLVNVASRFGYTPQYEGLEAVYRKYNDQGLVDLGLLANDFVEYEPGTGVGIKTI